MGSMFLFVILHLHVVSGLLKGIVGLFVNLGHGHCEFCGCRVCERRGSRRVRKDSGVLSVEYHEWTLACRAVNPIIVGELSEREPITPVGLLVVNENPEVLFDLLVNMLSLSICLRVECHSGVWRDVEHSVEFFHELRDELGTSVRDHCHGHTVSCVDMVAENSGLSFC